MVDPLRLHYVVGDIHGCLDELVAIEARIARHAARREKLPLLVSVGDLIDRGPDSAGVVRRFREGAAAGTHAAVLGNHEQELLRVMAEFAPHVLAPHGGLPPSAGGSLADVHAAGARPMARRLPWREYRAFARLNWLGQGGSQALESWGVDPWRPATWRLPELDAAFLCGLPLHWENEAAVATHALARADELALARRRAAGSPVDGAAWCDAVHGLLWRREPPDDPPDAMRIHVSGHTPLPRPRRPWHGRALQIDTACVYGRRLTAWCVETGQMLSVPARQTGWG